MQRKTLLLVALCVGLLTLGILRWHTRTKALSSYTANDSLVARVHDQHLYQSDLDSITATVEDPAKKAEIAAQYRQNWMAKQLLIAEAEAHGGHNKADIERRVLDYRYALLVHNYIEQRVNAQLDRTVTDQDIEAYYAAHAADFTLRHNIFKGKFIVLPQEAPNKAKVKQLLKAQTPQKLKSLKSYCFQFAKDYSLDENTWMPWDELLQSTPWSNTPHKKKLLKTKRLLQISDKTYNYYLTIKEYRTINDPAPLSFVKDQVRDVIIYKRKIKLANKIKEDILAKAQNSNYCIVYDH